MSDNIKPTPDGLLKWAIQNSQEGSKIDQSKLMSHEEFKEFWEKAFPDEVQALKENLQKLQERHGTTEELYYSLDRVLFIVEGIDQADWFADLNGFEVLLPYLTDGNSESRMASAWIYSNAIQNNPKVQQKFMDKIGMNRVLLTIPEESNEKAATRKFGLLSSAIRGFKPLRIQFYESNGIKVLLSMCEKFPSLYFRLTWLIGAILDEEDPEDKRVFNQFQLKELLKSKKSHIDDEELLHNVISRI